jgi:hypothetical protein
MHDPGSGLHDPRPSRRAVAAALLLGWIGVVLHNLLSLPDLPPASAETLGPGLLCAVLLSAYVAWPGATPVAVAMLGWGLVNLIVGAILSVLPVGVFPFEPEQTVGHYAAHLLYGLLEAPLVVVGWRALSRRRPEGSAA